MKLWCLVIVLGLLTACSSSPERQIQYYSLSLSSSPVDQPLSIGRPVVRLMPVQLASPLDQSNVQTQQGPHRVHAAHWHQWSSDPGQMLTRRLVVELTSARSDLWIQDGSQQWPSNDNVPRLVLDLDHFQGDNSGNAVLAGQWRLYGTDNKLVAGARFGSSEPLTESGYPALVAALDSLVSRMAGSIARALPAP